MSWWRNGIYLFVLAIFPSCGALTVNPSDLEAPPRYPNPVKPEILCLMCSPGTYLKSHCTLNLTNSVCQECEVGRFSINYNRAVSCEACRTPEKGCPIRNAHLIITCNSTTNNFCVCNNGYYYHSKSQNPMSQYEGDCELHTSCPVGEGVKVLGTADNDTRCEHCPSGFFSDKVSSTAACQPYRTCSEGTVPKGGTRKRDMSCQDNDTTEKMADGEIIGIVLGVLIAVIIMIVIVFCLWKRRRRQESSESKDEEMQTARANGEYAPVSQGQAETAPEQAPAPTQVPATTPALTPASGNGVGDATAINQAETASEQAPAPTSVPATTPALTPVSGNGVGNATAIKPKRPPWDDVCRFLSANLCGITDYRMALRSIMGKSSYKNGDALIIEHTMNHPRDVKEVIYLVLKEWTKKCPCTLDMVFDGLEELNLKQMICDLKQEKAVKNFITANNESTGESTSSSC
ncbi:tumor necrosis factor receptor superfamily member 21-like [Ylistrum balloti]|uniref:tumor necrosis factor receptor superfamily member 21-like n=1 Tax=Ylistrum balloti TaxID=509963 RepID=UPI0029059494|nr:tumor necrosis factor receptor superfamily member 21-like [Ylistrum balloti]